MHNFRRFVCYLWTSPTSAIGLLVLIPTLCTGGRANVVEGVLEISGGFARWILIHGTFLRGGATAMTLGHVVLARDEQSHELTRSHERVHVKQAERWGPFFLPAYGVASLIAWRRTGRAYYDNAFEREAFERASEQ